VLQVQLIDPAAEHFTVGGMYHGRVPPYRLDASSIDLKKIKNEAARRPPAAVWPHRFKALFFRKFNAARPAGVVWR
jgi:hypothetical protein